MNRAALWTATLVVALPAVVHAADPTTLIHPDGRIERIAPGVTPPAATATVPAQVVSGHDGPMRVVPGVDTAATTGLASMASPASSPAAATGVTIRPVGRGVSERVLPSLTPPVAERPSNVRIVDITPAQIGAMAVAGEPGTLYRVVAPK